MCLRLAVLSALQAQQPVVCVCLDAIFCRLLNLNQLIAIQRNIYKLVYFRYVISTGGDYDSTLGQAVPGFSIFHYGLDLIAVVSTGEDVWELKVTTQIICGDLQRSYCDL